MLPNLYAFRHHLRLPAILGLLALCLQLLAVGIGNLHAAERLAQNEGAIEICTSAGMVRITEAGTEYPNFQGGSQHCPFCASMAGSPPLLAVALSFFLPEGATTPLLPLTPQPSPSLAPDQRHAPNRAPPFLFA